MDVESGAGRTRNRAHGWRVGWIALGVAVAAIGVGEARGGDALRTGRTLEVRGPQTLFVRMKGGAKARVRLIGTAAPTFQACYFAAPLRSFAGSCRGSGSCSGGTAVWRRTTGTALCSDTSAWELWMSGER